MIFGRHADRAKPQDQEVDVDVHLEWDITAVQSATYAYLDNPGEQLRKELLSALERLDEQTAASDAYEASMVRSSIYGFSSKGSVIGETSQTPMAEELLGSELRAQVTLVKAAKAAVTAPGPSTIEALRTASSALAAMQPPAPEAVGSEGTSTADPPANG